MPSSVERIGKGAFAGATMLREIILGENIIEIGEMSFAGCSNLNNISLPDNISKIGDGAFTMCIRFENIILPKNLTKLNFSAFSLCSNLKTISFNENIKIIEEGAFSDCYQLTDITFPTNIKEIGESAFENCYSLGSIIIPSNITGIGNKAFGSIEFSNNIISKIQEPFAIEKETFDDYTYKNIVLNVPFGTKSLYENISGWNNFQNIMEGTPENDNYSVNVLYNEGGYLTYNGNRIISGQNISYDKQSSSSLKIYPYENYNISKVTFNGNIISTSNNEIILSGIETNSIIECEFKIKEYTLRIIEPDAVTYSELLVEHGSTPKIKIQSNTGKEINSVKINGEIATDKLTNGSYYKMNPIKENTTIVINSENDVIVENAILKTYLRYWNINKSFFIESDKKIKNIEVMNYSGQVLYKLNEENYSFIFELQQNDNYMINVVYFDGETELVKYLMK